MYTIGSEVAKDRENAEGIARKVATLNGTPGDHNLPIISALGDRPTVIPTVYIGDAHSNEKLTHEAIISDKAKNL